ncbi:MAG: GNAT family N-acetyltransferase [Croceitalea sp.]|nr:GNAT family N-acetyltransferase [Croceitalea sp.]NNM18168.1 GNAT family N-acetyltransferase [Croceitalea sp.]
MQADLQPFLENQLVKLRPLRKNDFNALFKVAGDPDIWKLHQCPDRYQLDVFKEFFEVALKSKGALVIIDKKTGEIIGSSRYKPSQLDPKAVEIGWSFLAKTYWGGTYNKAFKTLMIDLALIFFEHVIFYVDQNNFRSQRAMEKLGAVKLHIDSPLQHLRRIDGTTITYCISKL